MSITINIAGTRAVLADGKWQSADTALQQLLTGHLATLVLPAHHPPADREIAAARAAVEAFNGTIVWIRRIPDGPSRTSDGRQIVF